MAVHTLAPHQAARLANAVYGIRTVDSVAAGFAERGEPGLDAQWALADARVAHGRSGAVFRPRSGFGVVLDGRGEWQGHKVVLLRGTVTGADWLSNFNVALDRGPMGLPVAAGFSRIYTSLGPQIAERVGNHSGPIHVVGHSLGGALAQLAALDLAARGHGTVCLYTFGAPRVLHRAGLNDATALIGAGNIHRVCNPADPVPLVPIWPYAHASGQPGGIRVGAPSLGISIAAHFMDSYKPLCDGQSWEGLRAASSALETRRSVDYWLSAAAEHVRIPGSATAFWALGQAVRGLLALADRTVGMAVLGAVTVLDGLSTLLMNAASVSAEIGSTLNRLITIALRWLGRPVQDGVSLTVGFVRYVLELLFRPLAAMASSATDREA